LPGEAAVELTEVVDRALAGDVFGVDSEPAAEPGELDDDEVLDEVLLVPPADVEPESAAATP
jgi:hypothetical protein